MWLCNFSHVAFLGCVFSSHDAGDVSFLCSFCVPGICHILHGAQICVWQEFMEFLFWTRDSARWFQTHMSSLPTTVIMMIATGGLYFRHSSHLSSHLFLPVRGMTVIGRVCSEGCFTSEETEAWIGYISCPQIMHQDAFTSSRTEIPWVWMEQQVHSLLLPFLSLACVSFLLGPSFLSAFSPQHPTSGWHTLGHICCGWLPFLATSPEVWCCFEVSHTERKVDPWGGQPGKRTLLHNLSPVPRSGQGALALHPAHLVLPSLADSAQPSSEWLTGLENFSSCLLNPPP